MYVHQTVIAVANGSEGIRAITRTITGWGLENNNRTIKNNQDITESEKNEYENEQV